MAKEKPAQPNIVLINADDLGWTDVGYQGSDYHETPNIDRLAKEGMVFSAGYAGAGNCIPSRACLISGNYTPRHSVYAVGSTSRGRKNEMRLIPISGSQGLPKEGITIAEGLQAAGYVTGIFGKWHLNGIGGTEPEEQGFDTVFLPHGWREKSPEDPKGIYALTTAACEFMEENRDQPFFVYLAHYAIHAPLQGRPSTIDKFKAKEKGELHKNPMSAACTYDLDDGVGMLLKGLADLGLEYNTLVVLTSDNGGLQCQEPLRGIKGSYYEGGIREPFIVRWPGVAKPGGRCDVPVTQVDLFPTFLDVAGVPTPEGKTLDGESILPLLTGGELKRQSIFWHFPGYLNMPIPRGRELDVRTGFRSRPVTVIRKGDWKLHLYHEEWQLDGGCEKLANNHAVELYNLKDDMGERNDLSNANTTKRDELLADLLTWKEAIHAQFANQPNPKYRPTSSASQEEQDSRKD
jgi:arylsulfatase A-like enzyme